MLSAHSRSLLRSLSSQRRFITRVTHPIPSSNSKTSEFIKENAPFAVATYARPNLVFTKGKNCYLYDMEDREFIDFSAGIAVTALGHSNKEIADIIYDQSKTLIHSSNLFHNLYATKLSKELVNDTISHGGMHNASNVFLANSGTEANEAALKFARKYGKSVSEDKIEIITFKNSFHGRSMGALSVTPNPKYQDPFKPLIPGIKIAETENIASVEKVISDKTCGIIIEPVQGEGGINPISGTFLKQLKELAAKHDAILIYDEIQCGLGRTGKLWAHSYFGEDCHPDIITSAKALGNGFPIAATIVSPKVEGVLKVGDHGTTYGGNPLGSRIGLHVLKTLTSDGFLDAVMEKSQIFQKGLNEIAQKYSDDVVGIKGKGLILGMQFKDAPSKIVEEARNRGLIVITAGNNVVRFVPALTIEDAVITKGLKIFDEAIEAALASK